MCFSTHTDMDEVGLQHSHQALLVEFFIKKYADREMFTLLSMRFQIYNIIPKCILKYEIKVITAFHWNLYKEIWDRHHWVKLLYIHVTALAVRPKAFP